MGQCSELLPWPPFDPPAVAPVPYHRLYREPFPSDTSTYSARLAISELAKDYFDSKKGRTRFLPYQFIKTARRRFTKPAIADTTGKNLTFGKTLIASILLGNEIRRITEGRIRSVYSCPRPSAGRSPTSRFP